MSSISSQLVTEITDFFVARMPLEDLIAFKLSDEANERLHDLLDKNREEGLSEDERADLDKILFIEHLFTMLKIKARLKAREEFSAGG